MTTQPSSLARFSTAAFVALACAALAGLLAGQQPDAPRRVSRAPDAADVPYGPHERNVLDFWRAKSDKPAPLVIYIHGGGFRGGDKRSLSPVLFDLAMGKGWAVAAIHYRLSHQAHYPAPMLDSARAVQFLRWKAKEWNLDPARFAASGGSAGAGISLWLGFHDDLAKPDSSDPVERQSTRLKVMGVLGAQSSYDPRVISKIISPIAAAHPALPPFFGVESIDDRSPAAVKRYEDSSAINHLTADDAPVFLFYSEADGSIAADAKPGTGIHHPAFGRLLKPKMDKLGIECEVHHRDEYQGDTQRQMYSQMVAFFARQFEE